MNRTVKMIILVIVLMTFFATNSMVNAATVSFSVPSTGETGKAVNISATVTAAQWNLTIKVNGSTVATSSEVYNISGNLTTTFSGSYTPNNTNSLTITLTGDYTDIDGTNTIVNQTKTVSISVPVTTPTPPPTTPTPTKTPTPPPASTQNSTSTNKSTNNYLKELSIEGVTLTPAFNKNTTEYTVNVDKDVASIKISASAEDSKSTVTGAGTIELNDGENVVNVKVVSESGSTRTYTINVTKEEKEEIPLGIKTISITGVSADMQFSKVELLPDFNETIYEYTCNISPEIVRLIIEAELNSEEMEFEVLGADDLKDGENIIAVVVKNIEKEEEVIYKIVATRGIEEVEETEDLLSEGPDYIKKYGTAMIILAAVAAVCGIIFVVMEYSYRKKHPKQDRDNEEIENEERTDSEEEIERDTPEENEEKYNNRKDAKHGRHF